MQSRSVDGRAVIDAAVIGVTAAYRSIILTLFPNLPGNRETGHQRRVYVCRSAVARRRLSTEAPVDVNAGQAFLIRAERRDRCDVGRERLVVGRLAQIVRLSIMEAIVDRSKALRGLRACR